MSIQKFFPDSRFIFGGTPDEHLGQKLVLLIESKAKDSEKAGNLREELSKYLDRFSQPKEIIILDKFSETGSGKIDPDEKPLRMLNLIVSLFLSTILAMNSHQNTQLELIINNGKSDNGLVRVLIFNGSEGFSG